MSAHTAPVLLKIFGTLIESVEIIGNRKREDEMFNLVAKFCGKTLKRLKITNYNPNLNKQKQFPALEELILYNAEPIHFCLDSPLKYLEIQNYRQFEEIDLEDKEPWFVRNFPHLETVRFNSGEITDATLTEFLSFNQQLRALKVHSQNLTPMVFESIGFYSRNIAQLEIESILFHEFESSELHEELLYLNSLRKLSEFRLSGRLSMEAVFKMFVENNAPIRTLQVDIAATNNVSCFPTIETLTNLNCICRSDVNENCLIDLVKSQTALQTLQVFSMCCSNITTKTIEKMLKFGKNLINFEISFHGSDFDLESYNRILILARNRVKVRIIVSRRTKVNVPGDVLKINREWLSIVHDD